jgi:hypothetical protein
MLMDTWGFPETKIVMLLDEGEEVTEEKMPTKANIEVRQGLPSASFYLVSLKPNLGQEGH